MIPYDFPGVPHHVWMKALRMSWGDERTARKVARLLDESTLPIVEEGERVLGIRATAGILLSRGIQHLLNRIEDRELGPIEKARRRRMPASKRWTPLPETKTLSKAMSKGRWLGLCGSDQVRWEADGEEIPNALVAELTLRSAMAEGATLPPEDVALLNVPRRMGAWGLTPNLTLESNVGRFISCLLLPEHRVAPQA